MTNSNTMQSPEVTAIIERGDFVFFRDGVPEAVKPERWTWGVEYKDGTELHQFTADRVFHQFREIDHDNVKLFVMYNTADPSRRIEMPIGEGMQIFHLYRHIITQTDGQPERRDKVYVFGTKEKGEKAHYHYILPSDTIISSPIDVLDLIPFLS